MLEYKILKFETEVEEEVEISLEEELADILGTTSTLIVYNDDHNSFDFVIECFIEILGHSFEQSEQLAMLIHYKGRATVKTAPKSVLKPLKEQLCNRGISAIIEDFNKD